MFKKSVCALVFVALLLVQPVALTSCGKLQKFKAYDIECFDTATVVVGYAKNLAEFNRVSDRIFERLKHYHRLFDIL